MQNNKPMITTEDIDRLLEGIHQADKMEMMLCSDERGKASSEAETESEEEDRFEAHLSGCMHCSLHKALYESKGVDLFLSLAAFHIAEGNGYPNDAMRKAMIFGYKIGIEHAREIELGKTSCEKITGLKPEEFFDNERFFGKGN